MKTQFEHTYVALWFILVLSMLCRGTLLGQEELPSRDVERRLALIEQGKAEEVRSELPSLLTRYQKDPGVLYLQARLTEDATKAVKLYQTIVDNFGTSPWADDALYQIYRFYYAVGLYKTAEQKLAELRKRFPSSPYLQAAQRTQLHADEETSSATVDSTLRKGGYAIQVGAFSNPKNADRQRVLFVEEGYPVRVLNVVRGGKSYFLVWVGEPKTYEEAKVLSSEIEKKYHIETMIVSH
ncbi:MAG: SPOR domain-containing protein [Bacteroidota bacterium]